MFSLLTQHGENKPGLIFCPTRNGSFPISPTRRVFSLSVGSSKISPRRFHLVQVPSPAPSNSSRTTKLRASVEKSCLGGTLHSSFLRLPFLHSKLLLFRGVFTDRTLLSRRPLGTFTDDKLRSSLPFPPSSLSQPLLLLFLSRIPSSPRFILTLKLSVSFFSPQSSSRSE